MENMNYTGPTIGDLIIATLFSARSSKIFKDILRERRLKRYKKESVQVELYRLRDKGYLEFSGSELTLTNHGKRRAKNTVLLDYFPSPFSIHASKNLIVSFDIPEKKRILRNWLRNQLKIFGYTMLQQSLWIGPGPLPSEFTERVGLLGLRKNIKTFRINTK